MARPSKLTPAVSESICKTLKAGVDVQTACAREGIGYSTYQEWTRRARAGEQPYEDFLLATEQAMASVETAVTANILRTSQNQWQAGAWWLKWKHQRAAHRIEVSGPGGQPLAAAGPVQLSPEAADAIRRQILFGDMTPKPLAPEAEAAPPSEEDEPDARDFGTDGEEP